MSMVRMDRETGTRRSQRPPDCSHMHDSGGATLPSAAAPHNNNSKGFDDADELMIPLSGQEHESDVHKDPDSPLLMCLRTEVNVQVVQCC